MSAVIAGDLLGRVAESGEVNLVVLQELLVSLGVDVDADPENCGVSGRDLFLQCDQRLRLIHARRAPSGPEIQNDDPAAIIGELHLFPTEFERKGPGFRARDTGLPVIVTGDGENDEQAGDGAERYTRHDFAEARLGGALAHAL